MSRYNIPLPDARDAEMAINPQIGSDLKVYASPFSRLDVGDIVQTDQGPEVTPVASGIYEPKVIGNFGLVLSIEDETTVWTANDTHQLRDGQVFVFPTGAALPTGVTAGTVYYVRVLSATTFELFTTQANALAADGAAGGTGSVAVTTAGTNVKLGRDLQVVATNGLVATAPVRIRFNVTFLDGATGTATATLKRPTYPTAGVASQPGYDGAIFTASDLIGDGANSSKRIISVESLAYIINGARGNKYALVSLPDLETFELMACTTEGGAKLPAPQPVAIPCGRNRNAFVRLGQDSEATVTLKAKHVVYGAGLSRLNGNKVSLILAVEKDNRVLSERVVLDRVVMAAQQNFGEGDAQVDSTAEGRFESAAVFTF